MTRELKHDVDTGMYKVSGSKECVWGQVGRLSAERIGIHSWDERETCTMCT